MNVANIKRLYPYVLPYKRYIFLNIFFNVLYALFSSLSFVALIPMLEVLFDNNARIYQKPVYKGISEANTYFKEYLNYVRLKQAATKLAATKLTITDIAMSCGFNDSNYFKDAFIIAGVYLLNEHSLIQYRNNSFNKSLRVFELCSSSSLSSVSILCRCSFILP